MLKHLEPLPISEEMLGAYLEGNLTAEEVGYVESCLKSDIDLQELVDEVGYTGSDWVNEEAIVDLNPEYSAYGFDDFDLPEVSGHLLDSEWNDTREPEVNDFDITNNDIKESTPYVDDQEVGFNIDDNFEL